MSLVAMSLGRVADADFVHLATGEKYSELYQFVTGPIHAHLLGFVAFKACWEPNFFPGFTHSTSLPEFFPQLFEWMRALHQSFPEDVNSDWRFCLKRAWEAKDQKGMHPLTIDYLLQKVALPKVERPNDVYDAVAEISRKAHQNAKKTRQRRERGIKEQENRFKDSLISNWMPAALWCRSSVEILRIIEPQAAMTSDDVTALETEMSRLGLHRPPIGRTNLLERELARAEDKFFKHYGTDL
jgi:hypothetical protein